jgi:hypothetical protein
MGDPAAALVQHTAALTIATGTDFRDQQALAHTGLGDTHHTRGDVATAGAHYKRALTLYTELGMPEAEDLRHRLAALDQPDGAPAT